MKVKGWQIVVIVVGLLVGGWLVARAVWAMNDVDLPNTMYLVDVETGALYQYSLQAGRSLILPARRMDTNQIALLRIARGEDGAWAVSERDLSLLAALDKDVQIRAIDTDTGRLLTSPGSPAKYSPPMPK